MIAKIKKDGNSRVWKMSLNIKKFAAVPDEENVFNSVESKVESHPDNWAELQYLHDLQMHRSKPEDGGKKVSYYCDICLVDLSSKETMESHKNGTKHRKKILVYEGKNGANAASHEMSYIREVKPLKTAAKKIPIRLQKKLQESTDPVVGLRFITEIIACSNVEMEPYYQCSLCNTQGEANCMYNHVFGKGHRENFLKAVRPDWEIGSSGNIRSKVVHMKENGKEFELIRTIYSDELYPWSSGKAPWSKELGGTGIPPTNSRDSVVIKPEKQLSSAASSATKRTPSLFNISSDIQSPEELQAGYEAANIVLAGVSRFLKENLDNPEDEFKISACHSLLKANLALISNIAIERSSKQ